jgi:hypothetical protein
MSKVLSKRLGNAYGRAPGSNALPRAAARTGTNDRQRAPETYISLGAGRNIFFRFELTDLRFKAAGKFKLVQIG